MTSQRKCWVAAESEVIDFSSVSFCSVIDEMKNRIHNQKYAAAQPISHTFEYMHNSPNPMGQCSCVNVFDSIGGLTIV